MELLHLDKVTKYANDESERGGAVSNRSMKKDPESVKEDLIPLKDETRAVKRKLEDDMDMSNQLDDGSDNFFGRKSQSFRAV